jgi:acetate CoA/acetoacetate CoA-transferase alpha subunit
MEEALKHIHDGQTIMLGGFVVAGTPKKFCRAIMDAGIKDLHIITNDTGLDGEDCSGALICAHLVKKMTGSHLGTNPKVSPFVTSGELEVELVPQGSLAERIRCGGCGLGGVLTHTGVGTIVEDGKQVMEIDGKKYLLELPLRAELALIKAKKADTFGNLVYHKSARNFNPLMAMAADYVIAEVEEIVEYGEIDPDEVITPGFCVDMIVKA